MESKVQLIYPSLNFWTWICKPRVCWVTVLQLIHYKATESPGSEWKSLSLHVMGDVFIQGHIAIRNIVSDSVAERGKNTTQHGECCMHPGLSDFICMDRDSISSELIIFEFPWHSQEALGLFDWTTGCTRGGWETPYPPKITTPQPQWNKSEWIWQSIRIIAKRENVFFPLQAVMFPFLSIGYDYQHVGLKHQIPMEGETGWYSFCLRTEYGKLQYHNFFKLFSQDNEIII